MSCSACLVPGLSESLILVNQVVVASAGEVWVVTEVVLEEVEEVGLELEKEVGVEVGLEMLVGEPLSLALENVAILWWAPHQRIGG